MPPNRDTQPFLRGGRSHRRHLVGIRFADQVESAWAERRVSEDLKPVSVQLRRFAADESELQRDGGGYPDRDSTGPVLGAVLPADEESLLPPEFGADNDLEVSEGTVVDLVFSAVAVDEVSHVIILHELTSIHGHRDESFVDV